MQQWEYSVVELGSKQLAPFDQEQAIKKMAGAGWRLVSVTSFSGRSIYLYFERPKQ